MKIGNKIKEARIHANLTQEQAANYLGVSRQTISNWETCKTYPDIVSVIKMSDLYLISLDSLLKEERVNTEYMAYLEESTNIVKSKSRNAKLIIAGIYLLIWAVSIVVYRFFAIASDAMGYSLLFLWFLLPITTFTLSILIGLYNFWEKWKWALSIVFGVMYMLVEYFTFNLSNMLSFQKFNLPNFQMLFIGMGISLVGLMIGKGMRMLIARKQQDCEVDVDKSMMSFFARSDVKLIDKTLEMMFLLPCLIVTFVKPDAGMAVCMLLFFIVYPCYAFYVGMVSGKQSKELWWMPLLVCVFFLVGMWLFITQGFNTDMFLYALLYLIIGYATFGIFVIKGRK